MYRPFSFYSQFSLFWVLYVSSLTGWNLFVTQVNSHSTFTVICRHVQSREKVEWPKAHVPSWGPTSWCSLPSCFRSHSTNKCSFPVLCSAMFSAFSCFWLVVLLFKWQLKCCPVLLNARRGNTHVLDKLYGGCWPWV